MRWKLLKAREMRNMAGLSLGRVMRATGIDSSHLSKFERGEADMGTRKLRQLAELYGCTTDDLLQEADPPEPELVPA